MKTMTKAKQPTSRSGSLPLTAFFDLNFQPPYRQPGTHKTHYVTNPIRRIIFWVHSNLSTHQFCLVSLFWPHQLQPQGTRLVRQPYRVGQFAFRFAFALVFVFASVGRTKFSGVGVGGTASGSGTSRSRKNEASSPDFASRSVRSCAKADSTAPRNAKPQPEEWSVEDGKLDRRPAVDRKMDGRRGQGSA